MISILAIESRRVLLALALLASSVTAATTEPTSRPTATTHSADPKLPEAFAIFRTVNPFSSKKHPSTAEASMSAVATGSEASIVLNGVAQCSGGCTAFFTGGKGSPMLMLSVGDAVARGHVTAVDLDSVTYEAEGHSQRVEVGQNLNGQAPPASQPAANEQGKPDGPPGGPPDQGPPGAPGGKSKHSHGPHPAPPPPPSDQPSEPQQDQSP